MQCYSNANETYGSSNPLTPIEERNIFDYFYGNINKGIISLFSKDNLLRFIEERLCLSMISKQQDINFYIQIGTFSYYGSSHVILYDKNMINAKKRWLIRSFYSCVENGYCPDAYDKSLRDMSKHNSNLTITQDPKCNRIEDLGSQPDSSYRPIAFINFADFFKLYLVLIGFVLIIFIIEYLIPLYFMIRIIFDSDYYIERYIQRLHF